MSRGLITVPPEGFKLSIPLSAGEGGAHGPSWLAIPPQLSETPGFIALPTLACYFVGMWSRTQGRYSGASGKMTSCLTTNGFPES